MESMKLIVVQRPGPGGLTPTRRQQAKRLVTSPKVEDLLYGSIGAFVAVSPEDFEAVNRLAWNAATGSQEGKIRARSGGVWMHRMIMDSPHHIDHVNGDALDNRRENLRPATNTQNGWNRGATCANTSGYKGVSKRDDRWYAQIKAHGKNYHLGRWKTPQEAYAAYCGAAKVLHGRYAHEPVDDESGGAR